jgi:[ribosomal protein S5]-alanine N-acetyltransferase
MRIEGRHVHLEPFVERHLYDPRYLTWLRDREVMRYIGRDEYLRPFEFSMVEDYVRSLWANPLCAFWAVHALDDGTFIGTFKTHYGDATGEATRSADIGIMIGERSRWGKGYATDAAGSGCRHAFETLGARKLTAGANASNGAVVAAFRRIGFVEEGRLREKLLVDRQYHDHVLMGCFRHEFCG